MLNIIAWYIYLTIFLSVGILIIQGILIPFTIGVSVIFMPIPLVLLFIDYFLLKYVGYHRDFTKLSDPMQQRIRACIDVMRVCRVVTKVVLIGAIVAISIGAIVGLTLRYMKLGTVF